MANLAELGRRWGRIRPNHTAVQCSGIQQSWGALEERSDALARGMQARGVGRGDRVGILLFNCVEIPEVVLATLKLGAIAVPLNVMLTEAELTPIVVDAGCVLIVTEAALLDKLAGAATLQPEMMLFGLRPSDGIEPLDRLRVPGPPVAIADMADDEPAFICYTSGTTGTQKGAVLTHGNMRPGAMTKILSEGLTFHDRVLVPVQLVYTGAIISVFTQLVYYLGATMVLEPSFDPERCLDLIEHQRISVMSGVPVVYERMAQSADFARRDISSLRSLSAGGAPVSRDLLETYQERGVPMVQGYGLTETAGYATTLDFENAIKHLGFAGLPIMGSEIEIRDEAGQPVAAGEVGEVTIRGPHVMARYWNQPDLTHEAITDGWLRSGDLGLLDDEGFLKLVDRQKDMLISGGHNVYPAEIERVVAGIAGIEELAVIGVPDERWGQVPLLLVRSTTDLTQIAQHVRAACGSELAGYKRPKYVVSLSEPLPRTFAGKVSKPTLRKQFPTVPAGAIDV